MFKQNHPLNYRKYAISMGLIVVLLLGIKLFVFSLSESDEDQAHQQYFSSSYKVLGVTIPKDLALAGEPVPLYKFNVREGLDRELTVNTYWQSQGLMMHKLTNRWFPVIEPILKREGIPDDLKYVVLVESGLTNVVSPAGATGYWQLLESTAKVYGLEINNEVDERYHIEKSTEAACKYFKEAHKKFNNWTLVAASYNMGMAGVQRQLNKQQAKTFYDLLLNEETSRYIYRILAIKELISHPQNYGYMLRKKDLYPPIPTEKIKIDSSISDLADFALKQGINYKILKYFNPWLRKNTLSNKNKKEYQIAIPKKGFSVYGIDEFAERMNADSLNVQAANTDSVPESIIYTVKQGETTASIARQYDVDENLIKVWNELNEKDELEPEQELILYVPKKK